MSPEDFQELLISKWGYSFDVQIRKTPTKVFFQVMWRYLEQVSFPMDEDEYLAHLKDIVMYLEAMGCLTQVQTAIEETNERPRLGKAVNIPIDLGRRSSEWLLEWGRYISGNCACWHKSLPVFQQKIGKDIIPMTGWSDNI